MYILSQCGTQYTMVESYQLVQDVSKWFTLYANEGITTQIAGLPFKTTRKWTSGCGVEHYSHKLLTHIHIFFQERDTSWFYVKQAIFSASTWFALDFHFFQATYSGSAWTVFQLHRSRSFAMSDDATALERGFVFVLGPIDDTTNAHCNGAGADSSGESWFIVEGWFFCYV